MSELSRYEHGEIAVIALWQQVLDTFEDTLSSPRTKGAYRRSILEAMEVMGATYLQDLTASVLASHRAGLVERLDQEGPGRLSPATVSLELAVLRSFLHFCRLSGLLSLST